MSNILETIRSDDYLIDRCSEVGICIDDFDEFSELHTRMIFSDQIKLWIEHLRQASKFEYRTDNLVYHMQFIDVYSLFHGTSIKSIYGTYTLRYKSNVLDNIEFSYSFEPIYSGNITKLGLLTINHGSDVLSIGFTEPFDSIKATECVYKFLEPSIVAGYRFEKMGLVECV